MIPWNPDATAQDHLAAAREGLPCELCGGVCLAAAETVSGVVVLKFPQPVRMG